MPKRCCAGLLLLHLRLLLRGRRSHGADNNRGGCGVHVCAALRRGLRVVVSLSAQQMRDDLPPAVQDVHALVTPKPEWHCSDQIVCGGRSSLTGGACAGGGRSGVAAVWPSTLAYTASDSYSTRCTRSRGPCRSCYTFRTWASSSGRSTWPWAQLASCLPSSSLTKFLQQSRQTRLEPF